MPESGKQGTGKEGKKRRGDKPSSIKDLAMPKKLKRLKSEEIEVDQSGEASLVQLLSLKDNPEAEIKWTAFKDPRKEEFEWLKHEGMSLVKVTPPIYGMDLDGRIVLASHEGAYTFTMGAYNVKLEELLELFLAGLNNAKFYDLGPAKPEEESLRKLLEGAKETESRIKEELIEKSAKVEELEKEHALLSATLNRRVEELEKGFEEKEKEASEKASEAQELRERNAVLEAEFDALKSTIEGLKAQSVDSTKKGGVLEARVKELEKDLSIKENEFVEFEKTKERNASLEAEMEALKRTWEKEKKEGFSDEKVKELEATLEEKEKEVASKDAEAKEYQEISSSLERELEDLKGTIAELESKGAPAEIPDIKEYGIRIERLNEELASSKADTDDYKEKAELLEAELAALKAAVDEGKPESYIKDMGRELADREEKLTAAQREAEGYKKTAESMEAELEALRSSSEEDYKEKAELLEAELAALKIAVGGGELESSLRDMEQLLADREEKLVAVQSEAEGYKKSAEKLEAELEGLRLDVTETEFQLEEIRALKGEVKEKDREAVASRLAEKNAIKRLNSLEARLESSLEKITNLRDEIRALKTEAKKNERRLKSQFLKSENVNISLKERLRKLKKESDVRVLSLEKELERVNTDLEAKTRNFSEKAAELKGLSKLKKALGDKNTELFSLKKTLAEFETRAEGLEAELIGKDSILLLRDSELEELKKRSAMLSAENAALKKAMEDIPNYTDKISALEDRVKDMEAELEEREKTISHQESATVKLKNLSKAATEEAEVLKKSISGAKLRDAEQEKKATKLQARIRDLEKELSEKPEAKPEHVEYLTKSIGKLRKEIVEYKLRLREKDLKIQKQEKELQRIRKKLEEIKTKTDRFMKRSLAYLPKNR